MMKEQKYTGNIFSLPLATTYYVEHLSTIIIV